MFCGRASRYRVLSTTASDTVCNSLCGLRPSATCIGLRRKARSETKFQVRKQMMNDGKLASRLMVKDSIVRHPSCRIDLGTCATPDYKGMGLMLSLLC